MDRMEEMTFEDLWSALLRFQSCPFYTAKGLEYSYTIHGGEMKVDRKEKTITKSSIKIAFERARQGGVSGPKKLGVFGASYLYPVFVRIGVIAK
ncbi:MAG: hypothetical protein LIO81_04770 [Clostridiales bacterium]|nr:hypothetical protein [Clostridiales bacterium]